MTPYWEREGVVLYRCDALDLLACLPEGSIQLAVPDPPYCGVKREAWDNQWPDVPAYLEWLGQVCDGYRRVLAMNDSFYLFASPDLSARVELTVAERFNVLNRIRWEKPAFSTKAEMFDKDTMRAFFPACEEIIFAEQTCNALASFSYYYDQNRPDGEGRPEWALRIEAARQQAGLQRTAVSEAVVGTRSGACWNWEAGIRFPEPGHWQKLCETLPGLAPAGERGVDYDAMRREYEGLRRPFFATPDAPYTDTWRFPTVNTYPGKHPCEKPQALVQHMIRMSSRPGDVVLDTFMGGGSAGEAAVLLGRRFTGCDTDLHWCDYTRKRLERVMAQPALPLDLPAPAPRAKTAPQPALLEVP